MATKITTAPSCPRQNARVIVCGFVDAEWVQMELSVTSSSCDMLAIAKRRAKRKGMWVHAAHIVSSSVTPA